MALAVPGVRPALLGERTRELMHEARRFRHVVRHNDALRLKRADLARNLTLIRRLVPAFERDYRAFVGKMVEEAPRTPRGGPAHRG